MKETQVRDCFPHVAPSALLRASSASLRSAPRNCGRQSLPWLAAETLEGSGGGKPELAQAGGKDNGRVAEALAVAEPWVKSKIGG